MHMRTILSMDTKAVRALLLLNSLIVSCARGFCSLDAEEQIALEVVFRDGAVRIHNLGCVNVFKCQE